MADLPMNSVFIDIFRATATALRELKALYPQGMPVPDPFVGTGEAGEIYGTLTGARTPTKPFIVGLIPPDVVVNFVPVDPKQDKMDVGAAVPPKSGGDRLPPRKPGEKPRGYIQHTHAFWWALKEAAEKIKCKPEDLIAVLTAESGMDPGNTNYVIDAQGRETNKKQAKGLNQITRSALRAAKMTEEFWETYDFLSAEEQLPYVANCMSAAGGGRTFKNARDLYMANFAPGAIGAPPGKVIYDIKTNPGAIKQNPGLSKDGKTITAGALYAAADKALSSGLTARYIADYHAAIAAGPPGKPGTPVVGAAPAGIMSNGVITDQEDYDPLKNYGRNIQVANLARYLAVMAQVSELNAQIEAARAVPGLMMLVNPSRFTRNYEQTIDPVKVRRGYAVHVWNERPLSISCEGVTAAQYAFRADGEGGLTHFNRLHSISYKNLMSLVSIYRNNGHIYRGPSMNDPYNTGVPIISMSVFIYYDEKIYVGSFDDFSVTDNAEKPYNMSYNFKFTVRYEIDAPSQGLNAGV